MLRTKRVAWALALCLSTIMLVVVFVMGQRYLASVQWVEHTLKVTRTIDGLLSGLKDEENGQQAYLMSGDVELLDPYFEGQDSVPKLLAQLGRLTRDNPVQQQRVSELLSLVKERQELIRKSITLRTKGDEPAIAALFHGKDGKHVMDQIRKLARDMSDEEQRLLDRRTDTAASTQQATIFAMGSAGLFSVLLILGGLFTVHRDVKEVKRVADALAESEERYRVLAENASDLVRLHDAEGRALYASPSSERLLGYGADELMSLPAFVLVHPDDRPRLQAAFARVLSGEEQHESVEHRLCTKSGQYRWFELHFAPVAETDAMPRRVQSAARDITERRNAEEQLAGQAAMLKMLSLRDPLTQLYNRRGFLEMAEQYARVADRERRTLAIVFIDLDDLKPINDKLGHEHGDRALVDAADVLRSTCRASDVVARIGGDEFVVLGHDMSPTNAAAFQDRLTNAVRRSNERLDRRYRLSFSTGVAFFDPRKSESIESVLARADAVMYAEKRARRASRSDV